MVFNGTGNLGNVRGGKESGSFSETAVARKASAEQWERAQAQVNYYPTGFSPYDGKPYPEGSILIIDRKQVMSTCEAPWAIATADTLVKEIRKNLPWEQSPIRILSEGFGLGISATRYMDHICLYGGTLDVIELNEDVASHAAEWIKSQIDSINQKYTTLPHLRPRITANIWNHENDKLTLLDSLGDENDQPSNIQEEKKQITINLYKGDAVEVTKTLARMGKKYHGIESDTYPITDNEQGVNDLLDLQWKVECLETGGVFTFCAYYPGSQGGIWGKQRDLVNRYFGKYQMSDVEVNPPPIYRFLNRNQRVNDGNVVRTPVRVMPVVICSDPKFSRQ